jgi:hypothetical protein
MLSGIDISNHQGDPSTYRHQQWYRDAQFVIAQAIPRPAPNGYTGAQLRAALDDGKHRGIYTWMWDDPTWRMGDQSVEDDLRIRLATVPEDVELNIRPHEDLEDNQSAGWRNVTVGQRIGNARRALDVLDTWAVRRGLPEAGIYWSDYFIGLLYDGWDGDGRKQWKAHYSARAGSLIGGNVVMHQYTSTPIDMNVMLESEIVQGGNADVTDEERAQMQDKINGLVSTIGLLTGDDLKPLTRKSAGKYVKDYVNVARARAAAVGIQHA